MRFVSAHIADFDASALAGMGVDTPWDLTARAAAIVEALCARLDDGFRTSGGVAVHGSARVDPAATVTAPAIIGPGCFLAAGALVRGGCWLESDCSIGPGAELKASFLFRRSKLAHFNFVGESILGRDVNLEAGAIIANHRNEWPGRTVRFMHAGELVETGKDKFGAVVGDGARIGANAVIAPGALLARDTVVDRLSLIDQAPPLS